MGLKKIGLVILLVVIVGAGAYYFFGGNDMVNDNNPSGSNPSESNPSENGDSVSGSEEVTASGGILYDQSFSITSLPHVISHQISTPSRLMVEFTTDNPITFIMYDQTHYDEWSDGTYGTTKTTTGYGTISDSGSFKVDINTGEGGMYYFVFDGKWIGGNPMPTSGSLKITELYKLG